MKKLKLDLNDLTVESFETVKSSLNSTGGTVLGRQTHMCSDLCTHPEEGECNTDRDNSGCCQTVALCSLEDTCYTVDGFSCLNPGDCTNYSVVVFCSGEDTCQDTDACVSINVSCP